METEEIFYEKVFASSPSPPKTSFKDSWMKELGSEVAGDDENCQQIQPTITHPIVETGRLVSTEQPSSSSPQEIDKRFLLDRESTNERTRRPVCSCVSVSVERSDADENVDADQVRTGRPVDGEQSIDLFAQREEIDIDFKSVWIDTCSCETSRKLPCSRTREEDRESSSSTRSSSRSTTK